MPEVPVSKIPEQDIQLPEVPTHEPGLEEEGKWVWLVWQGGWAGGCKNRISFFHNIFEPPRARGQPLYLRPGPTPKAS